MRASGPDPTARSTSSTGESLRRPPALLAVVVAVLAESLVLLAVAATYVVSLLNEGTQDPVPAILTVVVALAVCVGLVTSARGLLRGRRWARAPVVTWQILQSAVVLPALGGPLGAGAVALLVLAAIAVGGLFVPAVVRATSSSAAPPVL